MTDTARIRLESPKITRSCGSSLASTLYAGNTTILLQGELGAGKTTFLQGFGEALGIEHPLTSPTYALEQHYEVGSGPFGGQVGGRGPDPFGRLRELIHIDLYRLSAKEASTLVRASDDFEGIRVIEWADRLAKVPEGKTITIDLEEGASQQERTLTITFRDIPLPSHEDILTWRRDVRLPEHIARHCDSVRDVAQTLGTSLLERGILLRPLALRRAAEVHDLLRFVDFRGSTGLTTGGASHVKSHDAPETLALWQSLRERYAGLRHEAACAKFLRERHFDAIARIVETHGVRLPPEDRSTIEQKLLFYADKRVALDTVVTVGERFTDFAARYGNGTQIEESRAWYEEAMRVEKELFPEGPPL